MLRTTDHVELPRERVTQGQSVSLPGLQSLKAHRVCSLTSKNEISYQKNILEKKILKFVFLDNIDIINLWVKEEFTGETKKHFLSNE